MDVVLWNGTFIKERKAVFSIKSDWGKFAPGFFETIKVLRSKPLLWEYHYERLRWGAKYWEIKLPSRKKLYREVEQLVKKNQISNGRLRIQFIVHLAGSTFDYSGTITTIDKGAYKMKSNGWTAGLYKKNRRVVSEGNDFKSNNRAVYLLAKKWANKNQLNEAFVMNQFGEITDAANCNLFWVKDGRIFTPRIRAGGVNGCLRRFLMKESSDWKLRIKERKCFPKTLLEADEIFVTNVIRGVQWIRSYEGKEYSNVVTKQVYDGLKQWEAL